MFNHNNRDADDRGQVGIGTLIVFIALVLVAAIAAGVLINTAGFLQNQAESTGQESTKQVTQSLNVQSTLGTANASSEIDTLELKVSRAPGAGPVNVTKSTIEYVSPYGAATLTGKETINDGGGRAIFTTDNDLLDEDNSQVTITIELNTGTGLNNDAMQSLTAGDEVQMKIVTPSGGQTTVIAEVPEPLTAGDTEQVRL
jgi:flagellin FlaB